MAEAKWKRNPTKPRQVKHKFLAVRVGYYLDYAKQWKYEYPVMREDVQSAINYYKQGNMKVRVQYHIGWDIWI